MALERSQGITQAFESHPQATMNVCTLYLEDDTVDIGICNLEHVPQMCLV